MTQYISILDGQGRAVARIPTSNIAVGENPLTVSFAQTDLYKQSTLNTRLTLSDHIRVEEQIQFTSLLSDYSFLSTPVSPSVSNNSLDLGSESINLLYLFSDSVMDDGCITLKIGNSASGCNIGLLEHITVSGNDGIGRMTCFDCGSLSSYNAEWTESYHQIDLNWYNGRCYVYVDDTWTTTIYDTSDWSNVYLYAYNGDNTNSFTLSEVVVGSSYNVVPSFVSNPQATPTHSDRIDIYYVDKGIQWYSNSYTRFIGAYIDSYGNLATETSIKTAIRIAGETKGTFTTSNALLDVVVSQSYSTGNLYSIQLSHPQTDSYTPGRIYGYVFIHGYADALDYEAYLEGGGHSIETGTLTVECQTQITDISTAGFTMTNTFTIPELGDLPLTEGKCNTKIDNMTVKENGSTLMLYPTDDNQGIITYEYDTTKNTPILVRGTHTLQIVLYQLGSAFTATNYRFNTEFTVP